MFKSLIKKEEKKVISFGVSKDVAFKIQERLLQENKTLSDWLRELVKNELLREKK